ncbi:MAG: PQQ-binding-like beta-propeller repeat protein [Chloroflexota bacterium]
MLNLKKKQTLILISALLVIGLGVALYFVLQGAGFNRLGVPTIHDGNVYVGSSSGTVYAYEMASGEELWAYDTGGLALFPPYIADNQLFIGGESGQMHAVDLNSGTANWTFATGEVDYRIRDNYVNSIPSLEGDVLYFTSEDFNLYAVDVHSGGEMWRFNLGEEVQQVETTLVDGTLYVGSWNGYLFAIDAVTGQEKWRSQTDNYHQGTINIGWNETFTPVGEVPANERQSNQVPYVTVSPIVDETAVYFADWTGNLFAVDITTGEQLWRHKPATVNMKHVGSRYFMSSHGNKIVYATLEDRHVYSVDKRTGAVLDSLTFDGWVEGPIQGQGNLSFLIEFPLSEEGEPNGFQVHGYDLETLDVLYTIENASFYPQIHDNVAYYGTFGNTIEGRDILSGEVVWSLDMNG